MSKANANSPLSLSDEDFLKASPTDFPVDPVEEKDEEIKEEPEEKEEEETEDDQEDSKDDDKESKEDDTEDDEEDDEVSSDSDDTEESDESDEGKTEEKVKPKVGDDSSDKEDKKQKEKTNEPVPDKDAVVIDYKAEYERILAPFKANGRDITVKSVDDAIALMQMGANYNKRMAALKPNLKIMRMLENNGLLSEDKLNFLIDLDKKNPEAINKLVKDSGIDPMDITTEKADSYKRSTYNVDDREIELDTALDELKDTPAYNQMIDIVGNKWDTASKQIIAGAPQILKLINSHIESGVYDIISSEVESERLFGRLKGLSDIEAYRQVGDAIQARGGFNHLNQGSSQTQGKPAPEVKVVAPKPKKEDDDKRKEKKRAASPSKAAPQSKSQKEFDPLSMSDEEFLKFAANGYVN